MAMFSAPSMKLCSRTIGSGTVGDSWESRELPKLAVGATEAKLAEAGTTSSGVSELPLLVAVQGSHCSNSRSCRTESLWVAVACFSQECLGHIYIYMCYDACIYGHDRINCDQAA